MSDWKERYVTALARAKAARVREERASTEFKESGIALQKAEKELRESREAAWDAFLAELQP